MVRGTLRAGRRSALLLLLALPGCRAAPTRRVPRLRIREDAAGNPSLGTSAYPQEAVIQVPPGTALVRRSGLHSSLLSRLQGVIFRRHFKGGTKRSLWIWRREEGDRAGFDGEHFPLDLNDEDERITMLVQAYTSKSNAKQPETRGQADQQEPSSERADSTGAKK